MFDYFRNVGVVLLSSVEFWLLNILSWVGLGKVENKGKFWKFFRKFLLVEIIVVGLQLAVKVVAFIQDPKAFIRLMKRNYTVEEPEEEEF